MEKLSDDENSKDDLEKVIFEIALQQLKCKEKKYRTPSI